jgi:hypothetical protein
MTLRAATGRGGAKAVGRVLGVDTVLLAVSIGDGSGIGNSLILSEIELFLHTGAAASTILTHPHLLYKYLRGEAIFEVVRSFIPLQMASSIDACWPSATALSKF